MRWALPLIVALSLLLVPPAKAKKPPCRTAACDAQLLAFFAKRPKLASTPAGIRQIILLLARINERQRSLQSARSTPVGAIRYVFGPYASQALSVAWCESRYSVWASNGQYQGLFQMGSSERATYGHGPTPLEQARAAYAYFVASGRDWGPWSCKPW